MPDYQKMYFSLFNAVTSAIELLQKAQNDGEQAFMEGEESASTPPPGAQGQKLSEER